MTTPASRTDRRPAWKAPARAFAVLALAGLLAGCADGLNWMLPNVASDGGWQSLPLSDMLTRPTINAQSLAFCRARDCGADATVAFFTASGPEARQLEDTIGDPERLKALITKPRRAAALPRAGVKDNEIRKMASTVLVSPTRSKAWRGVEIAIEGGPKGRRAYGMILTRRSGDAAFFVMAIASRPEVARGLAEETAN